MNPLEIYIVMRCDEILNFAKMVAIISTLATLCCLVLFFRAKAEDEEEDAKTMKSVTKKVFAVWLASCFVLTFVPSTKECLAIAILPKVVNGEDISAIKSEAGEAWSLAKQYLKTLIEEKEAEQ